MIKPLFVMPELLNLNGDPFDPTFAKDGPGSGCSVGCRDGCNSGCESGGGTGKVALPPID